MTDEFPKNDNSIPSGGECQNDYLSYTYKHQGMFWVLIILLMLAVLFGIGAAVWGVVWGDFAITETRTVLLYFSAPIVLGLIADLLIICFYDCEESYRLDENGLYCEHKKLLWRTHNTIPLNKIQRFIFNSQINYESNKISTVNYFVKIVTQNKTITILNLDENEKNIPEWFASSANSVLANLTGRDLETSIVSGVFPSSSDESSNDSEDPFEFQQQGKKRVNSSHVKSVNKQSIPPNCELREDYLSYLKQTSWRLTILFAILFVFLAIFSACAFMGLFSMTDDGATIKGIVFVMFMGSFGALLNAIRSKETGRLDINGFHYVKQSVFMRSVKDIPLNSIQEFRFGTETINTREDSTTIKFVELVDSKGSIRILTEDDNAFREWLVVSGNAVLANLKRKTREFQSDETSSDEYIDTDEFNDNNK